MRDDHFVLAGARSVTGRVFSREEHAQNHCQMGNFSLELEVMARWIASKS